MVARNASAVGNQTRFSVHSHQIDEVLGGRRALRQIPVQQQASQLWVRDDRHAAVFGGGGLYYVETQVVQTRDDAAGGAAGCVVGMELIVNDEHGEVVFAVHLHVPRSSQSLERVSPPRRQSKRGDGVTGSCATIQFCACR